MKWSKLFAGILTALAATTLIGCDSNSATTDEPISPSVANIVTFTGNNSAGATFSFNRIDDSPTLTLQSDEPVTNTDIKPGARVLLAYVPLNGDAYASGNITIEAVYAINCGKVQEGNIAEYPNWNRDGVYLYSIWRTGKWINIHCRLTYNPEPRRFMLLVDKSTLDSGVPELYLVHEMKTPIQNHERAYYASYDIDEVWSRPDVQGINIHIANTNLTDRTVFRFMK